MKNRTKIEAFGLLDLKSRRKLWSAVRDHFPNTDACDVFCVQACYQKLVNLELLNSNSFVCIACGDRDRVQFVRQFAGLLQSVNIRYCIWTFLELESCFNDLSVVYFGEDLSPDLTLFFDCIAPIRVRPLAKKHYQFIACAKHLKAKKIAFDLPSGLVADTGYVTQEALSVDYTLSFFYALQGLWTSAARAYVGNVILLSLPAEYDVKINYSAWLMNAPQISQIQPRRAAYSHKGCFKTVVVIAGRMQGAAILAAKAALVMGAGLVKILYCCDLQPSYGDIPEVIWYGFDTADLLQDHIEPEDIVIIGPGLGDDAWAVMAWNSIHKLSNSMVVDASALSFLSQECEIHPHWIITPHPGEAGKLLNCTGLEIQEDRFRAIQSLYHKYQAVCVLKGSGTLIIDQQQHRYLCPLGNAGMASPGMGDILCGLIAGSWAQGLKAIDAALYGVWLHALAGDRVAERSMTGIALASQVLEQIQYGVRHR